MLDYGIQMVYILDIHIKYTRGIYHENNIIKSR